jgi:hypothetical protein
VLKWVVCIVLCCEADSSGPEQNTRDPDCEISVSL